MSDTRAALDDFTGKWRRHWPEWALSEVFVPPAQRDIAVAWYALQQEWTEAAWGGRDAAPGLAKLAWWQEELRGWSKGARRHPLGLVLQPCAADWLALGMSLQVLRERDLPATLLASVVEALKPLSQASLAVEQALFGGQGDDSGRIPACLVAEFRVSAGAAADLAALRSALSVSPSHARVVRLQAAMLAERLQGVVQGRAWQPPPRWRSLWRAWRLARN